MSSIILQRKDKSEKSDNFANVYDLNPLSSIDKDYHPNILRIIKKAILGINFSHLYKKQDIISSIITKFIIANIFLLITTITTLFNKNKVEEIEITENNEVKKKYEKNSSDYLYKLVITNVFDIATFIIVFTFFKLKEKKLKKYMETLTQNAIYQDNEIIKNKYFCKISKDGNYNIEIKQDTNAKNKSNNIIFFEYVINLPNISKISELLYDKLFLPKEKEIVQLINTAGDALDLKYKKKLIFSYISIIICILVFDFFSSNNYFFFVIMTLVVFAQGNIFFNNKSELIKFIQNINFVYINERYFIYANSDIISIFYLKEEYKTNGNISELIKVNKKLTEIMNKYKLDS